MNEAIPEITNLRFGTDDMWQSLILHMRAKIDGQWNRAIIVWEPLGNAIVQFEPPMAAFPYDYGQELIDQLWRLGYRPTEGKESAGELQAVVKHLDDFRMLYFSTLNVDPDKEWKVKP